MNKESAVSEVKVLQGSKLADSLCYLGILGHGISYVANIAEDRVTLRWISIAALMSLPVARYYYDKVRLQRLSRLSGIDQKINE